MIYFGLVEDAIRIKQVDAKGTGNQEGRFLVQQVLQGLNGVPTWHNISEAPNPTGRARRRNWRTGQACLTALFRLDVVAGQQRTCAMRMWLNDQYHHRAEHVYAPEMCGARYDVGVVDFVGL